MNAALLVQGCAIPQLASSLCRLSPLSLFAMSLFIHTSSLCHLLTQVALLHAKPCQLTAAPLPSSIPLQADCQSLQAALHQEQCICEMRSDCYSIWQWESPKLPTLAVSPQDCFDIMQLASLEDMSTVTLQYHCSDVSNAKYQCDCYSAMQNNEHRCSGLLT
jgi:hypothetical protein